MTTTKLANLMQHSQELFESVYDRRCQTAPTPTQLLSDQEIRLATQAMPHNQQTAAFFYNRQQ